MSNGQSRRRKILSLLHSEDGEGIIEYVLVGTIVIVGSIVALQMLGCQTTAALVKVTVGVGISVPAR